MTQRREMVSSLRLRGLTLREISAALAKQNPPIVNPTTGEPYSDVTIKNDLDALKAEWRERAAETIDTHQARQLAELMEIKRAAWAGKDPELALKALAQEVKLLGTLRQPDGININFNIELVIQTIEAVRAAGADYEQTFRELIEAANARARISTDSTP